MADRPLEFWDMDEWHSIVASWPADVKKAIGGGLRVLQHGDKPATHCKTLQDFDIPLLQLWHRSGQRVICTTEYASLSNRIHVLDAFMKDSGSGGKMRQADKNRIEQRVKKLKDRMEVLERSVKQTSVQKTNFH